MWKMEQPQEGTEVNVLACEEAVNTAYTDQRFQIVRSGASVKLQNLYTQKCLGTDGVNVVTFSCSANDNDMLWNMHSDCPNPAGGWELAERSWWLEDC